MHGLRTRRGFSRLVAGIGVGLGIIAAGAAPPADPAAVSAPIAALHAALTAAMKAGREQPFRDRYRALAPAVETALDLPTILQVSIGPRWPALSPATQAQLLHAFRRFTIASYVANFDSYDGEHFEVLAEMRGIGPDQVVETRMIAADGSAARIDYVMRDADSAWKAVDILMDGSISRVAVQRSDFRGLLGEGGAAKLIASLQRKVADLSDGALDS